MKINALTKCYQQARLYCKSFMTRRNLFVYKALFNRIIFRLINLKSFAASAAFYARDKGYTINIQYFLNVMNLCFKKLPQIQQKLKKI